jgi:hypothetical protein
VPGVDTGVNDGHANAGAAPCGAGDIERAFDRSSRTIVEVRAPPAALTEST